MCTEQTKTPVPKLLTIGSRKSRLAMIQTEIVIDALKVHYPDCKFIIKNIDTTGDNILDKPLAKIGEKALFTRELEEELLSGKIDLIVHSLKDLPTILPDGCCIGAIMKREDASDSLVIRKDLLELIRSDLNDNEINMDYILNTELIKTFGTSSLRRIAQLRNQSSSSKIIKDIRGNLNTRLNKLDNYPEYGYDCLILATAGLKRSNFDDRINYQLKNTNWYYAVSQGALGIECLTENQYIQKILEPIIDQHTVFECLCERILMKSLEGGCSVPIGVQTLWSNDNNTGDEEFILTLKAKVLTIDGKKSIQNEQTINLDDNDTDTEKVFNFTDIKIQIQQNCKKFNCRLRNSVKLGRLVAQNLIDQGVKNILQINNLMNDSI